jgi:anti-sigma regulatory factor (Ser/Thr protein kinase)
VAAAKPEGFLHDALFYSGDSEYVEGTGPFIRAGLAADEPILVVVQPDKIALLRDAIGRDADSVVFKSMKEIGHNPGCILAEWRDFVAQHATSTRSVRGIGEPVWPQRSADELTECHQHESLLNVAFADGTPWSLLCPYDVDALETSVVDDARRTHPYLVEGGERSRNADFDSHTADIWLNAPLTAPPSQALRISFDFESLRTLRGSLVRVANDAGMSEARVADLVLAVNEIASNSVAHGGGSGTLSLWTDQRSLICDVYDEGHLADPLAGRRRPEANEAGGRGMWLANQLSDLTQLRRTATGTRIRLHFSLD